MTMQNKKECCKIKQNKINRKNKTTEIKIKQQKKI